MSSRGKSFCRHKLFATMGIRPRSTLFKQRMATFSTSREYQQEENQSNRIPAQVQSRWFFCNMAYCVPPQTGSQTYPTKALASFWQMLGLTFGWGICEEVPTAFVIWICQCIQISFGILGKFVVVFCFRFVYFSVNFVLSPSGQNYKETLLSNFYMSRKSYLEI